MYLSIPATVQELKHMDVRVLVKELVKKHLFHTALFITKVVRVRQLLFNFSSKTKLQLWADSVWIEAIMSMKKQVSLTHRYVGRISFAPRSRAASSKLLSLYGFNVIDSQNPSIARQHRSDKVICVGFKIPFMIFSTLKRRLICQVLVMRIMQHSYLYRGSTQSFVLKIMEWQMSSERATMTSTRHRYNKRLYYQMLEV